PRGPEAPLVARHVHAAREQEHPPGDEHAADGAKEAEPGAGFLPRGGGAQPRPAVMDDDEAPEQRDQSDHVDEHGNAVTVHLQALPKCKPWVFGWQAAGSASPFGW